MAAHGHREFVPGPRAEKRRSPVVASGEWNSQPSGEANPEEEASGSRGKRFCDGRYSG